MEYSLDKISIEENTDKSSLYHNYANKYDKYFNELRNDKIKLLEIGVLLGNSLKMWDRYFTNLEINAIDINPNCKNYEKENIKIFIGDQSNIDFLEEHFNDSIFDIVIDDGSHIPKHQISSFEFFFKKLKPGGIYVIEDLHTSYCPDPHFSTDGINFVDYLKNKVNDLQLNGKDSIEWSYGDKKNHLNVVGWEKLESYNYYEKHIEYIHFYKSICFIKKEIW